MKFWDKLAERFRAEATSYKTPSLTPRGPEIEEGTAYCRIWLVEMRLAYGTDWFNNRYPVVYAAVRYEYDGNTVTIPYIAGATALQWKTDERLDRVINGSIALTPQFPYQRGLVELQAGLFSMRAENIIGSFIETMQGLASLLPVPELSAVLKVAGPIQVGIEKLFDQGESRFELGYVQTFTAVPGGNNRLRSGYFAVILAEQNAWNDDQLSVVNDRLYFHRRGEAAPKPLIGYNYMLFRIDSLAAQDWEALSGIKELVTKAQDAIINNQQAEAQQILAAIRVAIARSPDVVRADRKAMFLKIEQDLKDLGLQAQGVRRSLYQIMQGPLPDASLEFDEEWERLERLVGSDGRGLK